MLRPSKILLRKNLAALKLITSVPQKSITKTGKGKKKKGKSQHKKRYLKCHVTEEDSHSRIYSECLYIFFKAVEKQES